MVMNRGTMPKANSNEKDVSKYISPRKRMAIGKSAYPTKGGTEYKIKKIKKSNKRDY